MTGPDYEADADWADEWDDADSNAYQDRVEAGLEPDYTVDMDSGTLVPGADYTVDMDSGEVTR